jgi:hypothetical protein
MKIKYLLLIKKFKTSCHASEEETHLEITVHTSAFSKHVHVR